MEEIDDGGPGAALPDWMLTDTGAAPAAGFATPTWQDPVEALRNPEDAWWFEQSADGLCVPASCAMIFNQLTGQTFTEDEIVGFAQQAGLLTWDGESWSGMTASDGATLLNLLGVPSHEVAGGTIDDLERWVDIEQRSVILAVDSDEVWYEGDDDADAGDAGSDHALRLAEIDRATGIAVLEDPGNPDGRGFEISIADLEDAWQDGGATAIVTAAPGELSSPGAEPAQDVAADVATAEPVLPEDETDVAPLEIDSGFEIEEPGFPLSPAGAAVAASGASAVILIRLVVDQARTRITRRSAAA